MSTRFQRFEAHRMAVLGRAKNGAGGWALLGEWFVTDSGAGTMLLPVMLLVDDIGFVCGGCGVAFSGRPCSLHTRHDSVWAMCSHCSEPQAPSSRRPAWPFGRKSTSGEGEKT